MTESDTDIRHRGVVTAINFEIAGAARAVPIIERESVNDFNNGDEVRYEGKHALHTQKPVEYTNTDIDFTDKTEYDHDDTVVKISGGSLELEKSVPASEREAIWVMNSSAGSAVIDSTENNYDGVASIYTADGDAYSFLRGRLKLDPDSEVKNIDIPNDGETFIGCWVYIINYKEASVLFEIIAADTSYTVCSFEIDGRIRVRIKNVGDVEFDSLTDASLNTGQWYYLGFHFRTVGNGYLDIYIDGVIAPVTKTGTPATITMVGVDLFMGPAEVRANNFDIITEDTSPQATFIDFMTFQYGSGSPHHGTYNIKPDSWTTYYAVDDTQIYIYHKHFGDGAVHNMTPSTWSTDAKINGSSFTNNGAITTTWNAEYFGYPAIDIDRPFSCGFWLKFTGETETGFIFEHVPTVGPHIVTYVTYNQFVFQIDDVKIISNPLVSGVWYYIICTYDGTKTVSGLNLLINGVVNIDKVRGSTITSLSNPTNMILNWGQHEYPEGVTSFNHFVLENLILYYNVDDVFDQAYIDFQYNSGAGTNEYIREVTYVYSFPFTVSYRVYPWLRISDPLPSRFIANDNIVTVYNDGGWNPSTNNTLVVGAHRTVGEINTENRIVSIDVWVYLLEHSENIIFKRVYDESSDRYYELKIGGDGRPVLMLHNNSAQYKRRIYNITIPLETWTHIAWDHSQDRFYTNGGLRTPLYTYGGTENYVGIENWYTKPDNPQPDKIVLSMGNMILGNLKGYLDEFIIYDRILYSTYPSTRYNNGIRSNSIKLKALPEIYYNFESTSNTVYDNGLLGINALETGTSVASTDSIIGTYSRELSLGSDIYVQTPELVPDILFTQYSPVLINSSVEFWIKILDTSVDSTILLIQGVYDNPLTKIHYAGASDKKITLTRTDAVPNTYTIKSSVINDNLWHHVVISRYNDGYATTTIEIYVDNVEVSEAPAGFADNTPFSGKQILIGKGPIRLDGFTIYTDHFLGATDVNLRYNGGVGTTDSPDIEPLLHYEFDGDLTNSGSLTTDDKFVAYHKDILTGESYNMGVNSGSINFGIDVGRFDFDDSFTFEIKFKSDSSHGVLITKINPSTGQGYDIILRTDGSIEFRMIHDDADRYDIITTDVGFNDNSWHHLFVVFNGTVGVIYIDTNTPRGLTTVTDTLTSNIINSSPFYMARLYTGSIGDSVVFSTALTAGQITERLGGDFGDLYPVTTWHTAQTKTTLVPYQVLGNMVGFTFTETAAGQTIKYLFILGSLGRRYKWDGDDWVQVDAIDEGNTKAELDVLTADDWAELLVIYNTLPGEKRMLIRIGLYTTVDTVTPAVNEIGIVHNGYKKCTPSEIEIDIVDNLGVLSTVRNVSGGDFTEIVVYTMELN